MKLLLVLLLSYSTVMVKAKLILGMWLTLTSTRNMMVCVCVCDGGIKSAEPACLPAQSSLTNSRSISAVVSTQALNQTRLEYCSALTYTSPLFSSAAYHSVQSLSPTPLSPYSLPLSPSFCLSVSLLPFLTLSPLSLRVLC